MIKTVQGNIIQMLLSNQIDILIHGCTCQSELPIGLGHQISITFPEVSTVHWKYYISKRRSAEGMVGNFSEHFYKKEGRKYGIINLYTQVHPGPDLRENKMKIGLSSIFSKFGATKKNGTPIRYGMPIIGNEWGLMSMDLFINHLENIKSRLGDKNIKPLDLTIVTP